MSPAPVSLMDKKAWPALKSCNQHTCIASVSDLPDSYSDWLSQLPNDILMLIMSYLTIKEAAKTSLLSPYWKQLWHYIPILTFEDSKALQRIRRVIGLESDRVTCEQRSIFVCLVNSVVEQHLGTAIDEFKVIFDLDSSYQSHIDYWLIFAFEKHVKRLELDCEPISHRRDPPYQFCLPFACCKPLQLHPCLDAIKPALTSLCLAYVNVTDEVVECFLRFFPFLEKLRIVNSVCLTSIRGSSLSLKHLKVCYCWSLKIIDLSAPKLLSFGYQGDHIEDLHIRNASSLSKVAVGDWHYDILITYTDDFLSKYSSQLEYLKLRISLFVEKLQLKLCLNPSLAMMNLKHLQLCVSGSSFKSLLEWTPLFEASPRLQKLKVQFKDCEDESKRIIKKKHDKRSLKCLKTLEIVGFAGRAHELELVTYVLENATVLEKVTIDAQYRSPRRLMSPKALETTRELKEKLPRSVKLILKNIT